MVKNKMVKNLPPQYNTRSSKMRNLLVGEVDHLATTVYIMTSSKKLEAVTNLKATRDDVGETSISVYFNFNVPNININDIMSVRIKWKVVTKYYPVSFSSDTIFIIKNNMSYVIDTSIFKDDDGKLSFGSGYGHQWEIQVTYKMNNGEESETATIISDKYT